MREVLAACRRSFGEAPRRFGATRWAYLTFDPPSWADDQSSPSLLTGTAADAWATYRGQEVLRQHGRVVWGAVVHANRMLFRPGPDDLGATLVYSEDPHFDDAPQELLAIARRVAQLYQGADNERRPPTPEAMAPLIDALAPGDKSVQHVALPQDFTEGRAVFVSHVYVAREHLPGGYLAAEMFPVLVAPERTVAVTPLPGACWPEALVAAWTGGDLTALAGRAPGSVPDAPWHPGDALVSAPSSPGADLADAIAALHESGGPSHAEAAERAFARCAESGSKEDMPVEVLVEALGTLVAVGQRGEATTLLGALERWDKGADRAASTAPRWALMRDVVHLAGILTERDAKVFARLVVRARVDRAAQMVATLVERDGALRSRARKAVAGSKSALAQRLGRALPTDRWFYARVTLGGVLVLLASFLFQHCRGLGG